MKIERKIVTLILVTLIIFILTSTTQVNTFASSSLNLNSGKTADVAVIFFKLDDAFTMRLVESLKNIEKEKQNKVRYTFFDPQSNIARQSEQLDTAIRENYDLIILYLSDKKENTVAEAINRVKTKNIPLILMNISPEVVSKVSKLYDKVAFVTPDSRQTGIAQGKILVDLWNSNKEAIDKNNDNTLQYILLQGPLDDPQAVDRSKYAISIINDSGIKTQQLGLVHGNWLKDVAKSAINNLFLSYNGKIEAIISNNDTMAVGAIEALQNYGYNKGDKSKNIAVVGIGGIPEAIDLIDKGLMTGTIIQDPNILTDMLYKIGMNLINNTSPIENTNYTIVNGEIMIPFRNNAYTGKSNNPL